MKKYYKKLFIIAFLIVGTFFVLNTHFSQVDNFLESPGQKTVLDKLDVIKEKNMWRENIQNLGAKEAYRVFKEMYKRIGVNRQHTLAHIFGEVLFKENGLSGVSVCDMNFSFGCYHEFLGLAIHEHGLSVIDTLNLECTVYLKDQALGCQHGIGHGILAYNGYEYKNLIFSLELCDTLPVHDPIGGCKGGVFMEYNMQTTLGDAGNLRPFTEDEGIHFPCSIVEDIYKETCYFWQPQWWQSVLIGRSSKKEEQAEKFGALGELCEEIQSNSVKTQCYRGIGNNAPGLIGWSIERMRSMCSFMPTEMGTLECLVAGAGAFFANEQHRDKAKNLCEMQNEKEKQYCLTVSNLPH